mmetsp:Transcript_12202/g.22220  ORF Transcript_12202/g.22220 Transcript_12202/m.22220 type:complete len:249 (+) Transcript_12202:942-1688(+)
MPPRKNKKNPPLISAADRTSNHSMHSIEDYLSDCTKATLVDQTSHEFALEGPPDPFAAFAEPSPPRGPDALDSRQPDDHFLAGLEDNPRYQAYLSKKREARKKKEHQQNLRGLQIREEAAKQAKSRMAWQNNDPYDYNAYFEQPDGLEELRRKQKNPNFKFREPDGADVVPVQDWERDPAYQGTKVMELQQEYRREMVQKKREEEWQRKQMQAMKEEGIQKNREEEWERKQIQAMDEDNNKSTPESYF